WLHAPALIGVVGVALVALVVASGVLRSRGRRVRWMPWLTWPKARWVFWPRVARYGAQDEKLSGLWARVAGFIGRWSRMSWVLTTLVLLVGSFFATTLKADGLSIADSFTTSQESVTGQQILGTHFPAGSGNPAVIIAEADKAAEVVAAAQAVPGIDQVVPYTRAAPADTTAQ